jgi:hypothetical protein
VPRISDLRVFKKTLEEGYSFLMRRRAPFWFLLSLVTRQVQMTYLGNTSTLSDAAIVVRRARNCETTHVTETVALFLACTTTAFRIVCCRSPPSFRFPLPRRPSRTRRMERHEPRTVTHQPQRHLTLQGRLGRSKPSTRISAT